MIKNIKPYIYTISIINIILNLIIISAYTNICILPPSTINKCIIATNIISLKGFIPFLIIETILTIIIVTISLIKSFKYHKTKLKILSLLNIILNPTLILIIICTLEWLTMKKKIIITIIIIILIFLLYKLGLILYYKDSNTYDYSYKNKKIQNKNITINKTLSNSKYKTLNYYIPETFQEISKNNSKSYIPKEQNLNNYTTIIMVGETDSCLNIIEKETKQLQTMKYKTFMQKNNLLSEKDLYKYYYNKSTTNNIFTPKNKIKLNYLSELCVSQTIISNNKSKYYYLENLDGILNISSKDKEFNMKIYDKKDNKYYYIYTMNDTNRDSYKEFINKDELNKILSSIYYD